MAKSVYLIAGLLTVVIFAGVFQLARGEDEKKINDIYARLLDQQERMLYVTASLADDRASCDELRPLVQDQLEQVFERFSDIEKFEAYGLRLETPEYALLKRQYLVAIMSLYLTLENTPSDCDFGIEPVLYFWPDESDCPTCATMVYQLEDIKRACPNVRVFAFPSNPANFEPVQILQEKFGVTKSPALVLGTDVITDIRDTGELRARLNC